MKKINVFVEDEEFDAIKERARINGRSMGNELYFSEKNRTILKKGSDSNWHVSTNNQAICGTGKTLIEALGRLMLNFNVLGIVEIKEVGE